MKRRVHETIELDQSLRQSRSIWLSFAIFVLPLSAAGIVFFFDGIDGLLSYRNNPGTNPISELWSILWGSTLVALDVFLFKQAMEASERLKLLQEDPTASVKPMPAPFQASLFGPYH